MFRNFVGFNHSTTVAKIAAAIFIVFSVGFLIYYFSTIEMEREYWKSVENYSKKHPEDDNLYCKYLEKYPAGEFKDIAFAECYAPKIGKNYQGGIIFYLDKTGKHGLIATPTDQGKAVWCNNCLDWKTNKLIGLTMIGTDTAVGTGKANTAAIVKAQGAGSYAAKLCDDLVLNGYDDWFLPSKDELNLLYNAIGKGFSERSWFDSYWSSSEYDSDNAWIQSFINVEMLSKYSSQEYFRKDNFPSVRAVRAF